MLFFSVKIECNIIQLSSFTNMPESSLISLISLSEGSVILTTCNPLEVKKTWQEL